MLLIGVFFVVGCNVKYLYFDIDYMLLGVLVECISGMVFDIYVES